MDADGGMSKYPNNNAGAKYVSGVQWHASMNSDANRSPSDTLSVTRTPALPHPRTPAPPHSSTAALRHRYIIPPPFPSLLRPFPLRHQHLRWRPPPHRLVSSCPSPGFSTDFGCFVLPDARYGTGYCDAQCPQDLKWINGEANMLHWTPSPTDPNSGVGGYGR